MRKVFPDLLEKGRETKDQRFATEVGQRFGFFRVKSPFTGATLRIMLAGDDPWKAEGMEGEPWDHVSVSRIDHPSTWQEMCFVKELVFDDDECVVQYHPAKKDYVNRHPNCLHLWYCPSVKFPMPPKICL